MSKSHFPAVGYHLCEDWTDEVDQQLSLLSEAQIVELRGHSMHHCEARVD
jgi:hypothetical protein